MKSKKFLISASIILVSIFVIVGIVSAFSKLSPSSSPSSTFYSLNDIYNLIVNNTTKSSPSSSTSTTTSPTATTSHSTSEIYALLANIVKQENVLSGTTILGVPGDYGIPDSNYATATASSSSLIPTGPLAIAKGYSLEDIYQLIINNTKVEPNLNTFPVTSVPSVSMHTTSDVYTAITDLIAYLNTNRSKFVGTILGVNGSYDPVTEGLVGYWPLDESSGSVAADLSGNGNNGTRFGASACPITTDGAYTVHTFTSSGTFTPPSGVSSVQVLVVAGGGAGGGYVGGGGGGGGVIQQTVAVSGPQTVIVGAGGIGNNELYAGENGGDSSFGNITALGGGSGSVGGGGDYYSASSGGSGGGGGSGYTNQLAGSGTPGQGYAGGDSAGAEMGRYGSGGGGGASEAGSVGEYDGGKGGDGFTTSISGESKTYGGGGGGSVGTLPDDPGIPGAGGAGGGGNGSIHANDGMGAVDGTSGTPNTGGGGGGGGTVNDANQQFSGGSGIVIVRYLTPANPETCSPVLGKIGNSTFFDGINSFIQLPNPYLQLGNEFSYSLWFKADSSPVTNSFMGFRKGYNDKGIQLQPDGNINFHIIVGGSWNMITTESPLTDDQWHLLNSTYDGYNFRAYVDGQEIGNLQESIVMDWTDPLGTVLGASHFDNAYSPLSLDEVAIWNRALSPTEIMNLYNKGVAGTPLIPSN